MGRVLLTFFITFLSHHTFANSCCGQSPASYTVLSLNQRLSLSAGYTYTSSQGRVFQNSDAFYQWSNKKRTIQSLSMNLASAFTERSQFFLNTSFLKGQYQDPFENGTSSHLSDTLLGYNYEILPEYSFSYWKPVVYLTALINTPTGKSIYEESSLSEGADVTGHNQWGAGFGVTLRKVYFPLTVTLQLRSLYIFGRSFGDIKVSSFYDNSVALLTNYASQLWSLSFNAGLTLNHLSQRSLQISKSVSDETQNFTLLAGIQRPLNDSWTMGLHYSDQTLVGPAKNSLLNRSLNLNFNYNYF